MVCELLAHEPVLRSKGITTFGYAARQKSPPIGRSLSDPVRALLQVATAPPAARLHECLAVGMATAGAAAHDAHGQSFHLLRRRH